MPTEIERLLPNLDSQIDTLRARSARLEDSRQGAVVGVAGAARRGKTALIVALQAHARWPVPFTWVELPGYGGLDLTPGAAPGVSLAPFAAAIESAEATIVLFVSMADPPINRDDQEALALLGEAHIPVILVQTKIDVAAPDQWPDDALIAVAGDAPIYPVSSATGAGMDLLIGALAALPWPTLIDSAMHRARARVRAMVLDAYQHFQHQRDTLAARERTMREMEAAYLAYLHQMTLWITEQEQSFTLSAQAEISRAVRASSSYVLRSREGLLLIYDLLRQKTVGLVSQFEALIVDFEDRLRDVSRYFDDPFPERALANARSLVPPDPAEGRLLVRIADRDRQLALYMQMVAQISDDFTSTLVTALRKVLYDHAAILQTYLHSAGLFEREMQLMAERDVVFLELLERLQTPA
jgi:hypothetical protein